MKLIVEADGGSRGNPGPAGYGAVVLDPATEEVLAERAEGLGVATNNVAEYQGLIAGLRAAIELGATEVEVRMDSKLVVEQMSGRWQVKHPAMKPLALEAARLVREVGSVRFGSEPAPRGNSFFFVQTFQRIEAVNSLRQLGHSSLVGLFSSRSL